MSLSDQIFEAGIVGAGGGGFPTHVKANSNVEFVLANGAECEPLIHKDYELMVNFPSEIVEGMELMMKATGAKKGYFGIKAKNHLAIEKIQKEIEESDIEMTELGDFYPSGDEYELVYTATNRLMPPYGIPLDVGCVVNNVETFYNVFNASKGIPLTEKFITVTGLVKNPSSFFVPIGTSFRDAINAAGGFTTDDFAIMVSGLLMGSLSFDLDAPITKKTAGLIVIPRNHYLAQRLERPVEDMNRIGKSACDQCSYCTEMCPRYLLGYDVQPHKVMRSLAFSKTGESVWNQYASLCCSCGLCSLYSCPEDLYPREACDQGKDYLRANNIKYEQPKPVKVHPIKEGRRVPIKKLMMKLNVTQFEFKTPYVDLNFTPDFVKIPLQQHIGAPAKAIVTENTFVSKGDLIGDVEEGKLGARIHASISGKIKEVNAEYIIITS
ncbi:MAG: 4Fe-4S dicluster domain-containing protein [Bacteroidetes bacterium]|nr:4Fe-4S dicluster domain-containing protein [Bacteroidota bacterium]